MTDVNDFNTKIIEEFRQNGGKVGGPFEGGTLLLLHHHGARTGKERVNPVAYLPVGEAFAVFGSKAGGPTSPDWYHNLKAHPDATVEVGSEEIPVTARELHGDERRDVWERQKQVMPGFADYEEQTKGVREIPVVLLERRAS